MAVAQRTAIVIDRYSHGEGPNLNRKGEKTALRAGSEDGKFGRLFALKPLNVDDAVLVKLGQAMREQNTDAQGNPIPVAVGDSTIPSGFTYLGQFIDHDVTFDPTSLKERRIDPNALENFRSPALDLDSIYGGGRATQPYLYRRRADDSDCFVVGETVPIPGADPALAVAHPNDLPRASNGLAILPDPRNDENLIVAQLHLAFMKFHNKVVELISPQDKLQTGGSVFNEARELVVWHYQWIVLHEFLPTFIRQDVLDRVLRKRSYVSSSKSKYPFIPVEFSMAAYRFGHSMVRERYPYNRVFTGPTVAKLEQLFTFTGRSADPNSSFRATPIPSNWVIDWRNFFAIDQYRPPAPARKIDTALAPALFALRNVAAPNSQDPGDSSNELAVRNLIRGNRAELPSGQAVAEKLRVPKKYRLTPEQIAADGAAGKVLEEAGLLEDSPLWYYILREAAVHEQGQRLGWVGSWIVATVFVGLLQVDEQAYMHPSQDPGWKPQRIPAADPGVDFTMADLLNFVGELNPLGD